MTEEITIVATETIRDETVVHSPDTTAEVNDAIITTITVITTGIVPSVTTPISHAGPCAIVAKNPARVAVEAVNAKAETTISSAVIGTVVEVVKPSTITIGLALNARTPISPSVNNATVVKLLALVAVVDDQIHVPQAVAEANVTETAAETDEAVAEAIVTETAAETDEAVVEAIVTETAAETDEAVAEAIVTETAAETVEVHLTEAAVAEATVTETAAETDEAHLIEAAVAEATVTETAAETVEVGNATAVIIARPKASVQAMHTTVHHVIYSRANLSAKMRTEGVELLEC